MKIEIDIDDKDLKEKIKNYMMEKTKSMTRVWVKDKVSSYWYSIGESEGIKEIVEKCVEKRITEIMKSGVTIQKVIQILNEMKKRK